MARGDELSGREIDAMITQLERRVDQLKKLYERYFIGIDRRPPAVLRRQVVREIFEIDQLYINNTAQKFRVRSLIQRFNSYKTYWTRTIRQIEEGTYHRDRNRAERREQQRQRREEREQQEEDHYEVDLEADFIGDLADIDLEEIFEEPREPQIPRSTAPDPASAAATGEEDNIKQQRLSEIQAQLGLAQAPTKEPPIDPPAPAKELSPREKKLAAMREKLKSRSQRDRPSPRRTISRPQRPASEAATRVARTSGSHRVVRRPSSDDEAQKIYNKFIEAKRRCNEPTDNLTFDAVKRSMDKQRQALREKRGSTNVDFQVVIKDGRAFLKPETND